MHGWNKFRQVTQDDKQLIDCWNARPVLRNVANSGTMGLIILCMPALRKKVLFPGKGYIIGKLDN